jgi:predicted transport protein
MPIFKNNAGKLKKLSTLNLDKEKNLQKLVEGNLLEVLELRFLATEYPTTFGGRIDSLAVDAAGAPVIIEYKRNKNDNVVNQALSYLKWLKAQKQEFFQMLMQQKLGKTVADAIKLDWKNPRVVCIAESYSKFDIDTVEVVPLRIELYKYRFYDEGIFSLEPVNVEEKTSAASSKTDVPKQETEAASLEELRSKGSEAIKQLFDSLDERIRLLDEAITLRVTTLYVAYRLGNNFAEVHIGKNQLKIFMRPLDYQDPQGQVEKIPDGYNWTLNRRVYLKSVDDLEYVMGLIEQSYQDVL